MRRDPAGADSSALCRIRSACSACSAAAIDAAAAPAAAHSFLSIAARAVLPSHPLPCRCNLQAKKKLLQRNAQQLLQRLDLGCCPDCPRVQQREAASLQAMAAWHEEWEQVCTLRLQALEQGHPYPPLTLPYLELQPFLPEGLPEDFPPSIDRCAACQNRLEEVSLLAGWQVAGTEAGRWQGWRQCSRRDGWLPADSA